jgi:hypothetical protein
MLSRPRFAYQLVDDEINRVILRSNFYCIGTWWTKNFENVLLRTLKNLKLKFVKKLQFLHLFRKRMEGTLRPL